MKTPTLPSTTLQPRKYTGPALAEVLAQRKQFLNPGIFLYLQRTDHAGRGSEAVRLG
ncbi:MAG: hypothetical protein QM813_08790 [Verrucomicrobiota bacterium]